MKQQYIVHSDSGHAWIAVKRKELERLQIAHKITQYSFQKGQTVYLEEDCDATLWLKTKKANGEDVTFRESYQEISPVRNYPRYRP